MAVPPRDRLVERVFDLWSLGYDHSLLQPLFYRRVHATVLRAVEALPFIPARVIDLGCGTARLTDDLARRYPEARMIGLDLSAGMLAAARRRLGPGGPLLVRGGADALPMAGGSVDLVVSSIAYHWLGEPQRALAEVRRVLRPGGRFVLATVVTHLVGWRFLGQRWVPARRHAADLAAAGFRIEARACVYPQVRVFTAVA